MGRQEVPTDESRSSHACFDRQEYGWCSATDRSVSPTLSKQKKSKMLSAFVKKTINMSYSIQLSAYEVLFAS